MKAFFDGFKKGLFGTWRFMGENGSVLMLFMSVIEYFKGWYVLSIHSILVAILFAIWDLKTKRNARSVIDIYVESIIKII